MDDINRVILHSEKMEKKPPVLSSRLALAAELAGYNDVIADIGSDHAFLPTYSVMNGFCKKAVIADISEGPVGNARKTVEEYGISSLCKVRIGDGLSVLTAGEADCVIIAGMGGELIRDIIVKGKHAEPIKKFILQPMSMEHRLRKFLLDEGYTPVAEKLCWEGDKLYTVISVIPGGDRKPYDEFMTYIGRIFQDNEYEIAMAYAERKLRTLKKAADGNSKAGNTEESQKYLKLIREITEYAEGFGNI